MAQPRPARQPSPQEPTLYFAFGSNLSLTQMATRCPQSLYIGRAVLPDYRWQINTRGFANVFSSPGHAVEGLVYQIDPADEASLDRSEGVARACYAKEQCAVDLYAAPPALYRQTTAWIVGKGGPRAVLDGALLSGGGGGVTETGPIRDTRVLVYIDPLRVDWGEPREEYIGRINAGVRDAAALGVSREYFDEVVRPSVPADPPLPGRGRGRAGGRTTGRRARGGSDRGRGRAGGEATERTARGGSDRGRGRVGGEVTERTAQGGSDRARGRAGGEATGRTARGGSDRGRGRAAGEATWRTARGGSDRGRARRPSEERPNWSGWGREASPPMSTEDDRARAGGRSGGRPAERSNWSVWGQEASPPMETKEDRRRSSRVAFARHIWRPIWAPTRHRSR